MGVSNIFVPVQVTVYTTTRRQITSLWLSYSINDNSPGFISSGWYNPYGFFYKHQVFEVSRNLRLANNLAPYEATPPAWYHFNMHLKFDIDIKDAWYFKLNLSSV